MDDFDIKNYGQIISKNLKRIAFEHDKTQADIARDLELSKTTVSSWMNGSRIPRMSKIDMLCEYFNVLRSEIMEPYDPNRVYFFSLTNEELTIVRAYRMAPESRKEAVRTLLNILEKGQDEPKAEPFCG